MEDLNSEAMGVILKYIYTGILSFDEQNVQKVLKAVDFLKITWVEDQCCEYLKNSLKCENFVEMFKLAGNIISQSVCQYS